jgi:DNA-directed RNA polymerase subunit RPC12/RpoP
MAVYVCAWCGRELKFDRKRGYVHPGGALYIQRCERCGAEVDAFPYPERCPVCGGRLVDDHCALPRWGGLQTKKSGGR